VARALVARRNPVIEAVVAEGRIEGKIEALIAILAARDIDPGAARERILRECDPHRLDRWIARAATASTLAAVLDGA
jgi:hypothetical protein